MRTNGFAAPSSQLASCMNDRHDYQDMYAEHSSRSPGSHRHQAQTLHRQPSRQFDAYGQMSNALYNSDDHASRYETNRFDRLGASMQGAGYGYELPGAQTWNPNAFGTSNGFSPFGATGRMKPAARGRSALPTVSSLAVLIDGSTDRLL